MGYNPYLDKLIRTRKLDTQKQFFLKRVSRDKWVESDLYTVKNSKFNDPYYGGNAIMTGITNNN